MPPELRVALLTLPLTRSGLREIAALLPEDDALLVECIEEPIKQADTDELVKLLYAAAMAGRKLPASLVAGNRLELFNDGWRFGWVAAHLEGDVTAAATQKFCAGASPLSGEYPRSRRARPRAQEFRTALAGSHTASG